MKTTSKIYAIQIDAVTAVEPSAHIGSYGGNEFELFDRSEDESEEEMIAAGYIRVAHDYLNGIETKWAELWEINKGRSLQGLSEISEGDINA